MTKHIFVTGGVVSSLGKGITSASIGRLLVSRGLTVSIQKLDPYLNVDPGTMSPFQHGEVFVTEDGAEADLDLGHYERFVDVDLSRKSNVTAGQIYWTIVSKERRGEYLGATVQVIPHVTNEIKCRIKAVAEDTGVDVLITEVGGTVGDIESLPFLEAIRQMKKEIGHDNVLYVHVTLIPYLRSSFELKTKPTQHSVKELRSIGIQPDILVCRSEQVLDLEIKKKLALFCDCEPEDVISNIDAKDIYEVPLLLQEEKIDEILVKKLKLDARESDLVDWRKMVDIATNLDHEVRIAIVGKYVQLPDAYISVVESLRHGGFFHNTGVNIIWVDAEQLDDKQMEEALDGVSAILVPGGFGVRGIEGKIKAINIARTHKIPFLGICLGLQCVVVEYARNVCGLTNANSTEFDENCEHPVIDIMHTQRGIEDKGGTMRLGAYPCKIADGSLASKAYGELLITERHRHRFEVNNDFRAQLEEKGLLISGTSPSGDLVEIVEVPDHPWFVAAQFHPEFKSRPDRPQALYRDFVGAALKHEKSKQAGADQLSGAKN